MHGICLSSEKAFEITLRAKTEISSLELWSWFCCYSRHSWMLNLFLALFIIKVEDKLAIKLKSRIKP